MFASSGFSLELKFAMAAYLLAGIFLCRRLDRRIAGSRVQLGDYVLGPLFLPLIALLSEVFAILRRTFRAGQVLLAFNPRDD